MPAGAVHHLRRNFTLGVVSGVAYNFYVATLRTEVVMTWFLSELTDSNFVISLLVPVELGSWYFLQLLLSGYVQRQACVLPLYRLMAGVRVVALALLCAATFALDSPGALLILFFGMFAVNSVAAGVAALPFLNVVAKTIPPTRRGMYFGWRRFVGGLLGLLGGLLVKFILSPDSGLAFPDNYALLFCMGLVITAVMVGSFSFVVEPAEAVDPRRVGLGKQLRRAVRLPARDRNYYRYLRLRVSTVVVSYAVPFYAVYARRVLDAPEDRVGLYLVCAALASVVFTLISGQVGDRRGNRLLIRVAALTAALPALAALLIARLPGGGPDKNLIFALVFVLHGLHVATNDIGSINYMLELAPAADRSLYVGFANGVVGLFIFASPLGGAIVDWLGFEPLFLFSLACGLLAVFFSLNLNEPRDMIKVEKEEL